MRVYLPILGQRVCPASMCPLFARDGSPWTGEKNARCPEHTYASEAPDEGGCAFWWEGGCDGSVGARGQVDEARDRGATLQLGPVRQKRHDLRAATTFDCPVAHLCQWQRQSGEDLCPPRYALSQGVDPRACAY